MESGFLKDPVIVNRLFLKKPERNETSPQQAAGYQKEGHWG